MIIGTMKYSERVSRTVSKGAPAWKIHSLAKSMQDNGESVIQLTIGDPDFDTPSTIIDRAIQSLRNGRTHYTPLLGEQPLRAAIADYHQSFGGQAVDWNNVIVVAGAQCGLYAASMCTLNPGDQIIVLDPTYTTYAYVLGATGAEPVFVRLRPENSFQVDAAEAEGAVTPRTRAMLINTPHNPTGAMINSSVMAELAGICLKHNLWMITDEVYGSIYFDQEHVSAAAVNGMADRTITISSLSKSSAMTGWRLGWAVGPVEMIEHMGNLSAAMLFGLPPFIQDAAIEALTGSLHEAQRMRSMYKARRDLVYERLQNLAGISCHLPEGGMYMMLDIRQTGQDTLEFAQRLLATEKVALLPGEAFGPGGSGHLRLSLVKSEDVLAEACMRIARFLESS